MCDGVGGRNEGKIKERKVFYYFFYFLFNKTVFLMWILVLI
jgi:hypothetical protein